MKNKKIFKKNYFPWKILFFLTIIILIFIFFFINNKNQYFVIDEFQGIFYATPIEKGGKKISNLNKKSLHLKNLDLVPFVNDESVLLEYSIQLYVSNDYNIVKNKLNDLLLDKTIFFNLTEINIDDFYILSFDTNIDIEFFLLYKNFHNKDDALEYCNNYMKLKNNCIVLNVEKLNS